MTVNITELDGAVTFPVRAAPRALRSEIIGEHDGALRIRIASRPVDGAANAELTTLFAKEFGVSKSNIEIIGGKTSKNKRIKINNLSQLKFDEVTK